MMKEKEYIDILTKASKAYYNTDTPIMSDSSFDSLLENFEKEYPSSPYLSVVGATPSKKKVKLETKMLSMGKAKTVADMEKWRVKMRDAITCPLHLSASFKLDGLSGKAIYQNGIISSLSTRGDGSIGQDISHLIPLMNIPKVIETEEEYVEVCGELIIPKDNGVYTKNLRNVASGIVGRESDLSEASLLHFVTFEVVGIDFHTERRMYKWLIEKGFDTLSNKVFKIFLNLTAYFEEYELFIRETLNYETDGMVITINNRSSHSDIDDLWVVDKHHHYNIAWKPKSESATTTLRNIEWNLSSLGSFIPKAVFDEVNIMGSKIKKCTLHNLKFVLDNKLVPGNVISISRANDVIPYFEENITGDSFQEPNYPDYCPYCGSLTEPSGVNLICPSEECVGKNKQKVINFVEKLNPEGLGESTVSKLFDLDIIRDIPSLFKIERESLEGLAGFKDAKIALVLNAVEKMKLCTFRELLDALSIPLIGLKALEKLKIFEYDEFVAFNKTRFATEKAIAKWKSSERNMTLLTDLIKLVKLREEDDILGKVVITGKADRPRRAIISDLLEKRYEVSSGVSKATLFILTDDVEGSSSKLRKARELGIKIMTYKEFFSE